MEARTRLSAPQRPAAFTLIEVMAVMLILALAASLVLPRLTALGGRQLRLCAEDVARHLEVARLRSLATGSPHRLLIDLEEHSYRAEWLAPAEGEALEEEDEEEEALDPEAQANLLYHKPEIAMSAPPRPALEFQPVPGKYGNLTRLELGLGLVRVATEIGVIEEGQVSVDFDRFGTATYASIVIDDEDGRSLVIDVFPLDDRVRIRDAES